MSDLPIIGTINENIVKLKNTKQDIKNAINTDFDIVNNEKFEEYADIIKEVNEKYKERIPIYEIRRKINDNTSPEWERLKSSVGLTATAKIATDIIPTNDFDNIYPWSDIKRCNINDEKYTFEGEENFALDGSNGNVFVHCPEFYYARWREVDGEDIYEHIAITKCPFKTFKKSEAFDLGAYCISLDENNKAQSISDKVPKYNYTRTDFRTSAQSLGDGYCLLDYRIFIIQMLFLVEYANYNSQVMLGQGIANYSVAKAIKAEENTNRIIVSNVPTGLYVDKTICIGKSEVYNNSVASNRSITNIEDYDDGIITGKAITFDGNTVNIAVGNTIWGSAQKNGDLNDLGYHSGCKVNDGFHSVKYRNIENIFGNLWQHVDGLNIKDYQAYICYNPTKYANDKFTEPYTPLGYINANESDKYIKELGYDENNPAIALPTVVGGSSTTSMCDNYWSLAGDKIVYLGGSFLNNWAKAGLFACYCNYTSRHANWNCGARLLHYQNII